MRTGTDPKEPGAAEPRTRAAREPSSQTPIRQGWTIPPFFDEYRVISRLSQGGMGEVYLGHDTLLDRPVAIKFMNVIDADAWMREQFLTEARAAARLQHNNVVGVYRVGELGGRPYIVSEFVRGQSLDTLPAPLPWQRALELGIGLTRGLAAAHRGGVLHRDIKPSNSIISSSGEVKLLDFGLAEFIDGKTTSAEPRRRAADPSGLGVSGTEETLDLSVETDELQRLRREVQEGLPVPVAVNPDAGSSENPDAGSSPTLAGPPISPDLLGWPSTPSFAPARSTRIAGTPHYMAPEIWLGEPSTRQSDIYGMGALLFESHPA